MVNAIEVRDLYYTYDDGTKALQGISFMIPRNAKVAVLGPNGAGKSTLLLHFNAIHLPQTGSVVIEGTEVGKKAEKTVRTKVGMVFQDPDDQIFSMTVWDDVAFGPINMGLAPPMIEERVNQALEAVNIKELAHKAPYHLSYGQKKRVAIAGVLAMEPDIIILDEPFAFLDPAAKKGLLDILNILSEQGKTILVATHDVNLAAEWAQQVIIIKEGKVLAHGDSSLLTSPEVIAAADLDFPTVTQIFQRVGGWSDLSHKSDNQMIPKTVSDAVETIARMLKNARLE